MTQHCCHTLHVVIFVTHLIVAAVETGVSFGDILTCELQAVTHLKGAGIIGIILGIIESGIKGNHIHHKVGGRRSTQVHWWSVIITFFHAGVAIWGFVTVHPTMTCTFQFAIQIIRATVILFRFVIHCVLLCYE